MSDTIRDYHSDIHRYHNYANDSSTALSELSSFVGVPGRVLTYGFPDLFRWLARRKRVAKAFRLALALFLTSTYVISIIISCARYLMSWFAASVVISRDDMLYSYFIRWLWRKKILTPQTDVAGQSMSFLFGTQTDMRIFGDHTEPSLEVKELIFMPQDRLTVFRHGGRFFMMSRQSPAQIEFLKHSADKIKNIRLWCLGRSTQPVQNLLQETVNAFKQEVELKSTEVFVNRDSASWTWAAVKPRRSIESVALEDTLKGNLLKDIETFRKSTTKRWYRQIGVPYRRGYLFHGAPGTGKSSLAFAIAGRLGLEIYAVSLLDRTLQDKDLPNLFSNIGSRALLLLEDIDSAGLSRESQNSSDDKIEGQKRSNNTTKVIDKKSSGSVPKSNITLSGLLNALDGVVAPEGHILVMTSNRPENLDPALIRAGRVDVHIGFTLATQPQAESIFTRMYSNRGDPFEEKPFLTDEDLTLLAKQFAAKIPTGLLSPADIQDYIIVRRSEPQRAIEEADAWVEAKRATSKSEAEQSSSHGVDKSTNSAPNNSANLTLGMHRVTGMLGSLAAALLGQ